MTPHTPRTQKNWGKHVLRTAKVAITRASSEKHTTLGHTSENSNFFQNGYMFFPSWTGFFLVSGGWGGRMCVRTISDAAGRV